MSEAQFHTFLTGGLALLIALMTVVAWNLWRMRQEASAGRASALEGVAHELRINLQRMISELSQVAHHPGVGPDVLLPIRSPQLDGVNRSLINTNRNGIAVLGSTYQEMEARKLGLRAVLAQRREPETELDDAMDAAINGISALYIWEVHKGAVPTDIGRVRSWSVRDWMKEKNFRAEAFPGMHLRDEVVERLRLYGVELTPRPLTHTAWEYYSMNYDRHADARGPLGRRRVEKEKPEGKGGLFGFGRKKEEDLEEETEVQLADASFNAGHEEQSRYEAEPEAYETVAVEKSGDLDETADDTLDDEDAPGHETDPQRTN
ncbi:MAG: hypothetical protein ACK4M6_09270 [Hyphomonas sp.]